MSREGASPKAAKTKSPLQKELMQVIKGRVAKGLGAEISPEEDDDGDSAAASGSDDDVLTELNNTLKFKKKDEGDKQPLRGHPAPVPNVSKPSDSQKALGQRSPSDVRPAAAMPSGKNTFGPADTMGRKSPLDGRLDSAARKAPLGSLQDGTGRKSPFDSHLDAAVGDRRSPLEALLAGGSGGRKSPLAGLADTPSRKSPFDSNVGSDVTGRQSPLDALLDFKKSRQTAAALTPPQQHGLLPAASQRSSAHSPAQLSEASPRGSESSSARQTPRDMEPAAITASPRLGPLVAGSAAAKGLPAATKGELTTKQKEEIIFGKSSSSGDAKKPSGSDKPAIASKLGAASILGIAGDSKKAAQQQSKSPRSELDALLADEKPPKEEAKVWKPPQFKTSASSPTLNEDGRKTPTGQQGRSLLGNFPDDSAVSREPVPKPKPRGKGHHDEHGTSGGSPAIHDLSGRSTPSSLGRRTPGAASDTSGTDEQAHSKLAKHAQHVGKPNQEAYGNEGKAGSGRTTPVAIGKKGERAAAAAVAADAPPSPAVDLFGRKATKSPALTQPADARSNASAGSGRASPAAAAAMARSQPAAAAAPDATKRGAAAARSSGKEQSDAGSWGFMAKSAGGNAVESPQPASKKKGYLQSLLGTADGGNDDDDDRGGGKDEGSQPENQSYLNRLLQQSPAGGEKSRPADNHQPAAARRRVTRRADAAGDGHDRDDSELALVPPPRGARHKVPVDTDQNEPDDSSVCFDVDKDPSQLAREKAEREARFQRFGNKQLTEKQENEMRIYEVADAQTSSMLRPIEPDVAAASGPGGKKAPVKPKARYAQSGDSLSPTPSTLSHSFDSTSDIRQFIYDEWKRAKSARAREERKAQVLKEKEEEEKKQKEAAEKLSSSKASYGHWKEAKAKALADMTKAQKDEERKKKEQEKKKAEDKAAAELAFRRWKEEKDEVIKAELKKSMKEKHTKEKESKEEQKAKAKDCTTAFTGWKTKKDEKLKQMLTEEEKQKKAEQEAKRLAQQDTEKMAEDLYRQWIHKKEEQKDKERRLRRERKLQELENPRPAWSPPNKTVPHTR